MLRTVEDVIEYADGNETLEFTCWHKGRFAYANSLFRVTLVANYRDELEPIEMLRELAYMDGVEVYCKKTRSVIYEDN